MIKTYKHPYNRSMKGKPFHINTAMLRHIGIPPKHFVTLTNDIIKDFVFATAADWRFFQYIEDAVATIQEYKPLYRIIVYDLGLRPLQVMKVRICSHFSFERFMFSYTNETTESL